MCCEEDLHALLQNRVVLNRVLPNPPNQEDVAIFQEKRYLLETKVRRTSIMMRNFSRN
jgi:hypothetical protein